MLDTCEIDCPCCGERISIVVDASVGAAEYVEDCEVCCRPLVLTVDVDEQGEATIHARSEND